MLPPMLVTHGIPGRVTMQRVNRDMSNSGDVPATKKFHICETHAKFSVVNRLGVS